MNCSNRMRNPFVMETQGHCLLCLKLPPDPDEASRGASGQVIEPPQEDNGGAPQATSLHRICHYLKLNMRKIFNSIVSLSPAEPLPVWDKSELKGLLCAECSELIQTISGMTLELEALQMRLTSSVRTLHGRVDGIQGNEELRGEFQREMLSDPKTLVQLGMVEELRREVLEKCSKIIGKAKPRQVTLTRSNLAFATAADPPETEDDVDEYDPIPIITSVQGNYQGPAPLISSSEVVQPGPAPPPTTSSQTGIEGRQCPTCHKQFETVRLRLDHERVLHLGIPFRCGICPSAFLHRWALHRHRREVHKLGNPRPIPRSRVKKNCDICQTTFQTRWHLLDHERVVHQAPKLQCQFCPATYLRRTSLAMHRSKKHGEVYVPSRVGSRNRNRRPPQENASSGSVVSTQQQRPLILESSIPQPSQNPQQQPPPSPGVQKVNTRECRICHKIFRRPYARRFHEWTVHQPPQFPCGFCPKKFSRKDHMEEHMKRVHKQSIRRPVLPTEGEVPPPQTSVSGLPPLIPKPNKIYQCRFCHKAFTYNCNRVNHERSTHEGVRYACQLCPAVYTLSSNVYRHIREMHKNC